MRKIYIISLIVVAFLAAIFFGAVNWFFQFTAILIVYSGISWIFLKKKVSTIYFLALLLPFFLLYGWVAYILNRSEITYPIIFTPFIGFIWAYIMFKIKESYTLLSVSLLFLGVISFVFMKNWIYHHSIDKSIIDKSFPEIELRDKNDKKVSLEKGKIYVIDAWTNTCSLCIAQFPKFEAKKQKYSSDSLINFVYLNFPTQKNADAPTKEKRKKIMRKYNKETHYALNYGSEKKLGIRGYPNYFVVDKDLKIQYKGAFNDSWYIINNIDDIIEKYK